MATVTATLSVKSSEAVTVDGGGDGRDRGGRATSRLSSDRTLTIAAGATTSAGTVTVTAVDDTTDEADETVDGFGDGGGRQQCRGAVEPDADLDRRRPDADAGAVAVGLDHRRERRGQRDDGDGEPERGDFGRGDHGDGGGDGRDRGGAGDFTLSSADTLTIARPGRRRAPAR